MGRWPSGDREHWWVSNRGYIEGRIFRNGTSWVVRQSRWIMEWHLGRLLLPNEIVHHINRIKTDNRIENLEVRNRGEHAATSNRVRESTKGRKHNISPQERIRRSEFMKEVHRRRKENDPTNKWYARTQVQQGVI